MKKRKDKVRLSPKTKLLSVTKQDEERELLKEKEQKTLETKLNRVSWLYHLLGILYND